MRNVQITAISKQYGTHEGITHYWSGTEVWARPDAVNAVRGGTISFYTIDGYKRVEVGVVNADPPYLRSYADGKWTDNLLALPTKPAPGSASAWR